MSLERGVDSAHCGFGVFQPSPNGNIPPSSHTLQMFGFVAKKVKNLAQKAATLCQCSAFAQKAAGISHIQLKSTAGGCWGIGSTCSHSTSWQPRGSGKGFRVKQKQKANSFPFSEPGVINGKDASGTLLHRNKAPLGPSPSCWAGSAVVLQLPAATAALPRVPE